MTGVQGLLADLKAPDGRTRASAAFNLSSGPRTDVVLDALQTSLGDSDPEVRGFAAQALALLGDERAFDVVIALAERVSGEARPERWAAAKLAAGRSRADRDRVASLLDALTRSDVEAERTQAQILLAQFGEALEAE